MADLSLMQKIREYSMITNTLGKPTTQEEIGTFNRIISKESLFNFEALDIAELRQFISEIGSEKFKSCLDFFVSVAKELGIACIDTENRSSSEVKVAAGLEDIIFPNWTDDTKESIETEVVTDMSLNEDVMPIPKIGLSDGSINRLKEICNISTEELVQAIKMLSSSRNGLDRTVDVDAPVEIKVIDSDETYTKSDYDNDIIGIGSEAVTEAVQRGMNIIYRGVPGCGKTFMANCDARLIVGHRAIVLNRLTSPKT